MLKNLKNKKKKGFTLIELIIVIAIIAILAAIALPKFGEVRENANIKSDIANAKNIQSAVVALVGEGKIDNGVDFDLGDESSADSTLVGNYLQSVPFAKASSVKDEKFSIEVTDIGDVIISVGENQVYPNASGIYAPDNE